ncbi:MAG TPA: glutathione S-transferase family protein [Rhodospirillales bacterium]|jgi:GST-like protein|nr:glutathione S-transferase family protein [Rhodospirillales bacterium]HIL76323.1 glutathione S-transferase family protein [Rhodospirillales bacterium]
MIDVYSWATPNGRKVHIMLEECNLAYTAHPIDIGKGEQFESEFLKISPNNRIPAITDSEGPDGKPISLFESGAILIYLAEKSNKFLPGDMRHKYETLQWLMFQMGGVGPMFGQSNHFSHYAVDKIPYAINRYDNESKRLYGVMDKQLANTEYLAGDEYTIADIATHPWAQGFERRGVDENDYPNVKKWVELIHDRPAVKRGFEVLANERPSGNFTSAEREILFGKTQFKKR